MEYAMTPAEPDNHRSELIGASHAIKLFSEGMPACHSQDIAQQAAELSLDFCEILMSVAPIHGCIQWAQLSIETACAMIGGHVSSPVLSAVLERRQQEIKAEIEYRQKHGMEMPIIGDTELAAISAIHILCNDWWGPPHRATWANLRLDWTVEEHGGPGGTPWHKLGVPADRLIAFYGRVIELGEKAQALNDQDAVGAQS